MKFKSLCGSLLVGSALVLGLWPGDSAGQAGAEDPQLAPLVQEIVKQQDAIIENQRKLDEKLAIVAENVRLARLFVSRGGGSAGGASPLPGK